MALNKVTYVNGETVIAAENLNAIQDEIIANGNAIASQATQISGKADAAALANETAARAAADTTLSGEVDELKSAFSPTSVANNAIHDGYFCLDAIWRRGSRNGASSISNVAYRVTTVEPVHVLYETALRIRSGFRYNLYRYDYTTGAYVSASGWSNAAFTLSPDYLYHINIARTAANEDTSEVADVAWFSSRIYGDLPFRAAGHEGDWCEISSLSPVTIDTVNKTMSMGTLILKCGSYRKNNPTIDFSALDPSLYQTIYYDFDTETIKVANYDAYQSLSNVANTAIIGSVYKQGTSYQNGYYSLNTRNDIIVNGVKQLPLYAHLRGKKLDAFGDSICAGRTDGGDTSTFTDTPLEQVFGRQLGITTINHAVGGKCWQKHANTGDIGWQIAQSGALDGDIALFFCGTNDYGTDGGTPIGTIDDAPAFESGGTFYAALHYVIQYVLTAAPAKEICLVTPTYRNYFGANANKIGNAYTTVKNTAGYTLGDYCDAIVAIGRYYNIPVLDLRDNSPINQFNVASMLTEQEGAVTGRYLHPKNATYDLLYSKIASWLRGVL